MPANRTNYIVIYEDNSQVYASGSEAIALQSPPPDGCTLEQKHVLFITYEPDNKEVALYELERDKVMNAELVYPKKKKKKDDDGS